MDRENKSGPEPLFVPATACSLIAIHLAVGGAVIGNADAVIAGGTLGDVNSFVARKC
jgi:3-oxoacyl-(acyl-carrier-protein) synthase